MIDPTGTLLAIWQIILLAFTAIGWGLLVERIAGGGLRQGMADRVLCMIAGWAACALFLQNLVYLGARMAWSAWPGLAVAAGGWITLVAHNPRQNWRAWLQAFLPAGTVAIIVILVQGAGLWFHGAHDYYGYAHHDQENYVQMAQFFIDEPFGRSIPEVGLHPWMVKGIDNKDVRIGQSIAQAYTAVISFADAKSAYGALSVFSIGITSMAVLALLRNLGLPWASAALGAVWVGCLPTVTKMHLDGFLSQTYVLCVLPALGQVGLIAGRHLRLALWTGALLLAMMLTGYTEIFVVAIALFAAGVLANPGLSFWRRCALTGGALALALLAVPAYISRFLTFMGTQYGVAASTDWLSKLVPRAGTWGGWTEQFFPVGDSMTDPVPQITLCAGFAVLALLVAGFCSRQPGRRLQLAALAATPLGVLAVLLSMPVFHKYPFAKLLATFAPLFAAIAVLGLWRTMAILVVYWRQPSRVDCAGLALRRRGLRIVGWLACCGLIAASGWASCRLMLKVIHNEEILAIVNSPETRALYRQIEADPGRVYLVNEQHSILNAWLCYHARRAEVYVDADYVGDRRVPSSQFAFRRPPAGKELSLLNRNGVRSFSLARNAPDITVRNPQGVEGDQNLTFYWIGDQASLEFFHFGRQPEDFLLSVRGIAGPANPTPHRKVTLAAAEAGTPLARSLEGDGQLVFPVRLNPGRNVFVLKVVAPTEWLVRLPGDQRNLMLRIQELNLTAAPPPEKHERN